MYIPLTLILGGGVGNLIDRVRTDGRVMDFIDFKIWPVFNFADSAIVCGMLVLLFHVLLHAPEKEDEVEEEEYIKNIKEYKEEEKE
jgi:signal peptidase II